MITNFKIFENEKLYSDYNLVQIDNFIESFLKNIISEKGFTYSDEYKITLYYQGNIGNIDRENIEKLGEIIKNYATVNLIPKYYKSIKKSNLTITIKFENIAPLCDFIEMISSTSKYNL